MPTRCPAARAVLSAGGMVRATNADSENAAALNAEPSKSLRRRMSRPDNSMTVRTVPSRVPDQRSPS